MKRMSLFVGGGGPRSQGPPAVSTWAWMQREAGDGWGAEVAEGELQGG